MLTISTHNQLQHSWFIQACGVSAMIACDVFLYFKWRHLHCHAHEQVRLLLEFMDLGTLRDALDRHVFFYKPPFHGLDYCSVLDTAADIAKGLLHLHSLNIIHGDLKVCSAETQSRPLLAACSLRTDT